MDGFLYDNGLRHERVKLLEIELATASWKLVRLAAVQWTGLGKLESRISELENYQLWFWVNQK